MTETPELDKMHEITDISQQIGEFLEWLESNKLQLGHYVAVLDPQTRYEVVECPGCSEECWRVKDECSISTTGLGRYHYDNEEEARDVAATLEDKRLAKAQENPVFQPLYRNKEWLLAQYFEIDLNKVEAERRALLDELRGAHS